MKSRTLRSPTGRTIIVEPNLQRLPPRTREAKELARAFAPDRVFHDRGGKPFDPTAPLDPFGLDAFPEWRATRRKNEEEP